MLLAGGRHLQTVAGPIESEPKSRDKTLRLFLSLERMPSRVAVVRTVGARLPLRFCRTGARL